MNDGHTWDNEEHASDAWWWDTECTAQELASEIDDLRMQLEALQLLITPNQ